MAKKIRPSVAAPKTTGARGDSFQESPLALKRRARKIYRELKALYPYAHTELDYSNEFELLVATVLSAQTTDVRVNSITPALFSRYPDPWALSQAVHQDVEEIIRPLGYYRNKTRTIISLSRSLVDDFDGIVPGTHKELVTLTGVGTKTANVVLGNAFGIPGLTVDTHFIRLVNRWKWVNSKDPLTIEHKIGELFEKKDWTLLSQVVIFHGRRVCIATNPACGVCPIAVLCPSYGIGEMDPEKALGILRYETARGQNYAPELVNISDGKAPAGSMKVNSKTAVFFPAWNEEPASLENYHLANQKYSSTNAPGGGLKEIRPKSHNHRTIEMNDSA